MATYGQGLRSGLPRIADGEPWPQGNDAPAAPEALAAKPVVVPAVAPPSIVLRRGLPRTVGGEPWPANTVAVVAAVPAEPAIVAPVAEPPVTAEADVAQPATAATYEEGAQIRRGLPREKGGEPWPPAGAFARRAVETVPEPGPEKSSVADQAERPAVQSSAAQELAAKEPSARKLEEKRPEAKRYGRFTLKQWIGTGTVGALVLAVLAACAVFFVRWLLTTDSLVSFLTKYPGEYHLPEGAPVGFPGWLGWQHFFNAFLMILIIRSGLQVRREQRPPAYWTPKNNPSGKVSLTIWFHQSLDVMWLINGTIFVVLLFVTGQWMRVVPTSWEVFPNALSAMLQYVSLDWPTDNGWVNYNGLQQLVYFMTIFIAAPLAAATGYRMSGMWPKDAKRLNKIYPAEWARAVHFPVMLYFVVFIFTHVALVLSTGALRNLNHMYAAQGSTDSAVYASNWMGFWMFVVSLVVIAAAWVAARPLVIAPIARLFGSVSSR